MKDAFMQHQMSGANSGAGEGLSAVNISDDETSPKWCVPLPVKSIGELDAHAAKNGTCYFIVNVTRAKPCYTSL